MLFPSDLGENIPENDPVRIVSRIVDGLNIDSLIETYEAFGCPPYHPRMLLKVVFYAYMNNTYSCRRIESAMLRDIYYVCPIGQRMHNIGTVSRKNENGYTSYITNYEAQNCGGCPLRCVCYKGKQGNRIISVNHPLRKYKQRAREKLLGQEGLMHRSKRPTEPEAVFGQMKFNKQYKRFRHRGKDKVNMDFGLFAIAFNIQKYARMTA